MTKEKRKTYDKKYREKHKTEIRKRINEWEEKNKEKRKKYYKIYMRTYMPNYIKKNKEKFKKLWKNQKRKKRKEIKKILVEMKGGKCQKCGYNKCLAALEFHHPNKDKKFSISSLVRLTSKKAKKETMKCKLLCANCHREIHNSPVS